MNRLLVRSNLHNIDHHACIQKLNHKKVKAQIKLDKRIRMAFMYCNDNRKEPICENIWNNVDTCLVDIDEINQEILLHTWYTNIEETELY